MSQGSFILFFVGAGSMTSLDFAASARRLADVARRSGHAAPGFRSPPRNPGCRRSIRRRRSGEAVIAVQVRQRPAAAVVADMIDGVVAANRLTGDDAAELRDQLWAAVTDLLAPVDEPGGGGDVRAIRAA